MNQSEKTKKHINAITIHVSDSELDVLAEHFPFLRWGAKRIIKYSPENQPAGRWYATTNKKPAFQKKKKYKKQCRKMLKTIFRQEIKKALIEADLITE